MKIRTKIFIRSLALGVFLIAAIVGTHTVFAPKARHTQVDNLYLVKVATQAGELKQLLLRNDHASISKILNFIANTDKCVAYAFVEQNGEPYASTIQDGKIPAKLLARNATPNPQEWKFENKQGESFEDIFMRIGETDAVLHVVLSIDEINKSASAVIWRVIMFGGAMVIVAIFLSMMIARWTTREIESTTALLQKSRQEDRQHHKQMLSIFDGMDEPIYIIFPDTYELLYVNNASKEIWGDIAGQKCFKWLHNRSEPCPFCTNDKILGEFAGKSYICELQNEINQRWYHCIDKVIQWPDGKMVRMEIAIDITDRQKAEEELRLRGLVLDQINDHVTITDLNGKILYVNEAQEKSLGFDNKKLIGQTIEIFGEDPQRGATQKEILHKTLKNGNYHCEVINTATDGSELITDCHTQVILAKSGEPLCLVGVASDVTDQKRAAEALRESEEKFSRAFNDNPAMIGLHDLETGKIIEVNATFCKTLGYTPTEILGKLADDIVSMEEKFRSAAIEKLKKNRHLHNEETVIHTKNGTPIDVLLSAEIIVIGGRKMVLTTAIDITSRKIAEEALAARVVDLARSNSQLQKFAYVASHDLQEPLRTITNFTDMLAKDIGIENLSEKSRMFMDFICSGSQRMKTLILDLLKYSRAEMKPTEIKKVNLSDSVDIAVANLSAAIEECSGEIKYEKLGSVHAVPTQMTQIFQNLIGNSLKYRGDDPPVIQISSQKKGKFIKISIADNGIGFDEKHKERIFEVFQRLFTMSEYSGTGIGLAICQRIVHNHGGDIWAEGIPETGSTFHFTIPRNAEKGR